MIRVKSGMKSNSRKKKGAQDRRKKKGLKTRISVHILEYILSTAVKYLLKYNEKYFMMLQFDQASIRQFPCQAYQVIHVATVIWRLLDWIIQGGLTDMPAG